MRRTVFMVGVVLHLACGQALGGEDLDPGPLMERLLERYTTDREDLERFHRAAYSRGRFERMEAFGRDWRERLEAVDFDALDADARVDYVLLRNDLDRRARGLGFDWARTQETLDLVPFAPDLVELEEERRRMEPLDVRAAAQLMSDALEELKAVRKRVEDGKAKKPAGDALKPSPVVALRAAREVGGLRRTLEGWFDFRNGYEPEFGWWCRKPFAALDKALEDYAKFLRENVAGAKGEDAPLVGDPVGREHLLELLAHEMIPYTPEELIAIAQREFAWCDAKGKKAAEELGEAGDWHAAVEEVKRLHSRPGEQDELVARQARDAIAFVDARDLVTIPPICRETWRLEMLSAARQKTAPFALYGGQQMLVAYPTDEMDHETKLMAMRGNNEHFTRIVTPHELVPGHHLQGYMARRHSTHRRSFGTPFLVEGWALYWEMRLWDLGYPRGPADRVGMLFWRKHRCARIIVSLGFHLGDVQPQEMIDFLVERVGLEKDGATAEVRRYIGGNYGALYQCAYMLGGLQLRALHGELVGDGGMTEREFHDAVLRENAIPVELIRARLTGAPLSADHRASWRFADE